MSTYDDDEVFDPTTVEITERELIPIGDATLQATQVVLKETKNGEMYAITFEVVTGPNEGRQLWENYNFRNASEQAQQIGRESLAKLCLAVGSGPFRKAEAEQALCFKPFIGKVGIRRDKTGNYPDQNSITSYKPLDNPGRQSAPPQAPQQRAAPQQTAAQQQAAAAGRRPWQRPAL